MNNVEFNWVEAVAQSNAQLITLLLIMIGVGVITAIGVHIWNLHYDLKTAKRKIKELEEKESSEEC